MSVYYKRKHLLQIFQSCYEDLLLVSFGKFARNGTKMLFKILGQWMAVQLYHNFSSSPSYCFVLLITVFYLFDYFWITYFLKYIWKFSSSVNFLKQCKQNKFLVDCFIPLVTFSSFSYFLNCFKLENTRRRRNNRHFKRERNYFHFRHEGD